MKRIVPENLPGVPHLEFMTMPGTLARSWMVLLAAATLVVAASDVQAATFLLKNGTRVEGEIVHATRNTLMVREDNVGGLQQLARSNVEGVEITTDSGETVTGTLESWSNGVYEIESDERMITIENRQIVAEGALKPPLLTISKAEADEAAAEMTFNIGLSRPSKKPILVIYATLDRTAKAGEDFLEERGSITLTPGITNASVRIPLINDAVAEDDEYFEVFVATDQNVAVIKSKRAIGTILNDDQ